MTSRPLLVIATPTYGPPDTATVTARYHTAFCELARSGLVRTRALLFSADLVRARSRAVRMFLDDPEATHLLFWDEDTVPDNIGIVVRMIEQDLPIVALPYPHKRIEWDRLEMAVYNEDEQSTLGRQTAAELEAAACKLPIHTNDNGEITGFGMGFMLIQRHVLETMTKHYWDELWFNDVIEGRAVPTCALFQLVVDPDLRTLLHEDFSFCRRWLALGGKMALMNYGATHIGRYAFRGVAKALEEGRDRK